MALPVHRPTVKRKDMGSVLSCIVSDKIGPGEISRDLAARVAHALGHAGGITLANPYLALDGALDALGLARGDAVILPALAPALWLRVILDRGLVPLVADVEPEGGSIDAAQAAALAQKGARAVLVPHTLGIVADVEPLRALGLPVLEDVSQAMGSTVGGAPVGAAADVCMASLAPESIITCGGGALITARSRTVASALKKIQEGSPLFCPLPDMNAALGIAQLAALEAFVAVRREITGVFVQSLLKSRHRPLLQKADAENVLASFPVALSGGMKDVRQYALKKSVDTEPAFAGSIAALEVEDSPAASCANARSLTLRCLLFPLYPMLGKRDVEAVCKVLATMP